MNPPNEPPDIEKLFAELEAKGLTREQINAHLKDAQAKRAAEIAREVAETPSDPLEVIEAKIDRLQESVDAIAAQLDDK
jgi:hypothetical protein